jgi:molybdopterin-guanine dinucleotide biosynthesis protein A
MFGLLKCDMPCVTPIFIVYSATSVLSARAMLLFTQTKPHPVTQAAHLLLDNETLTVCMVNAAHATMLMTTMRFPLCFLIEIHSYTAIVFS